jgi:hypothetical protein
MDCLRAAFPDLEDINFPPVAAGMLAMTHNRKRNPGKASINAYQWALRTWTIA